MAGKKFSITALLGIDDSGVDKGLKGAKGKLGKFKDGLKTAGKVGGAAVAAAAAATVAFGVKSVKTFASFEKGMNEVFTLLPNISKKGMDDMSKQALDLSTKMGILPDKVVPALYQALSAGVPPDNVFKFLETAAKASIGGATDLATAVDGLSSVVNSYGADSVDANKAADLMFTTVKLGKTTMEELSATLYNVLPVASSVGVGFDQVSAALAALTAKGVPTAQATTQLRQAILSLTAPAEGQRKAMAGLGIDVDKLKEEIKKPGGLIKAMNMIKTAAKGDAEVMKKLLGSVEGMQAVLALTSDDGKKFNEMLGEMDKAGGATDKAFKQMDQGVSRTFDRLEGMFEKFKVLIGKALAPVLKALEPVLTAISKAMENFPFEELSKAIDEFVKELQPVLAEIFGGDTKTFGSFVIGWVKTLLSIVLAIVKVIRTIMPIIKPIIAVLGVAFKILEVIFDFIGLLADALSGNFDAAFKAGEKIRKKIGELWNMLLDLLVKALKGLPGTVLKVVLGIGKSIFDAFRKGVSAFETIINRALDWLEDKFPWIIKPIKAVFKVVSGLVNGVLDAVGAAFNKVLELVGLAQEKVRELSKEEARAAAHRNKQRLIEKKDRQYMEYLRKRDQVRAEFAAKEKAAAEKKARAKKDAERRKQFMTRMGVWSIGRMSVDDIGKTYGMGPGQIKAAMLGKADESIQKWWDGLPVEMQEAIAARIMAAERSGRVIGVNEGGFKAGSKEWMELGNKGREKLIASGITGPMAQEIMRKQGYKSWEDFFIALGAGRATTDELVKKTFGEDFHKQFKSAVAANTRAKQKQMLQDFGVTQAKATTAARRGRPVAPAARNIGVGFAPGVNIAGQAARELACACHHLRNIDRTTMSIDRTLKGKFVNQ